MKRKRIKEKKRREERELKRGERQREGLEIEKANQQIKADT